MLYDSITEILCILNVYYFQSANWHLIYLQANKINYNLYRIVANT